MQLDAGQERDSGSGCSWLKDLHVEQRESWRLEDIDYSVAAGDRGVSVAKLRGDPILENRKKFGGEEQVPVKVTVEVVQTVGHM